MDSRREFIKKAAMIAGATGFGSVLPPSIQKAMAIDPAPGSTWLDAEHVVILMQENRSFDHCFGNLKGVRGFRDPRAITLPDGNPVWLQTDAQGKSFLPFRLDIKDTKATWMGSLPHSWPSQVDARNEGRHDQWLQAKRSGRKEYAQMPLTLGYYDRRDIPFYYALADAFTVCDQNFCSSLTGTTPNRLYLFSGTIRDEQNGHTRARVRNGDTDYRTEAGWTSFPERLEENGVDWRIYQNEISLHPGFKGEEDAWLSNFTDNPIEWFSQYHVRFSPSYMNFLPAAIEATTREVAGLRDKIAALPAGDPAGEKLHKELEKKQATLQMMEGDLRVFTPEKYAQFSGHERSLHTRAFTNNRADLHFRELTSLEYEDGGERRQMQAPKGDVLYQFRQDVKEGKLPAVSWLVAPENFSDHPGAPWYGAWYVSEVLDILTSDPEVWKKTVFVLCYDENDGYFDHVPPFVAPDPLRPETGRVSPSIDTAVEHVTRDQDRQHASEEEARGGPIGLGYRVPLVIASPWSRGGYVNSQVFDHTSILQLLERFTSHKKGKAIQETNISTWRRVVCGDLSSVFHPYNGASGGFPAPLVKDAVLEGIHKAQFRGLPGGYKALSKEEIRELRRSPHSSPLMPAPEKGVRPSCALPYELYAAGEMGKESFDLSMRAGNFFFGSHSAGAPFIAYAYGKEMKVRNYTVAAGDRLNDHFSLSEFEAGRYDLRVQGPNGFYRGFRGGPAEPSLKVTLDYEPGGGKKATGRLVLKIVNTDGNRAYTLQVRDHAYGAPLRSREIGRASTKEAAISLRLETAAQGGWYDLSLLVEGVEGYERRFAGRVETGRDSISDPAMG